MASRQRGVVLTYVDDLKTLEDCVRAGGYDTVKIVTGWGLPSGWSPEHKRRLIGMVPNIIVRTVAGDPSYARPVDMLTPNAEALRDAQGKRRFWDYDFTDPNRVQQELADWYALKPDIMIELGNEPNVFNCDDDFIWNWSYFLKEAINRCRAVFPKARLISPGLMMDPRGNPARFYEIAHDTIRLCDYIGVHFYEYYGFKPDQAPATKGELRDAIELHKRFFADKQWYVTEFGINDTKQVSREVKGQRYAALLHASDSWPALPANVVGAVYYHLAMKGDLHPEYHIYPEGDRSYATAAGAVLGGADVLGGGMEEMVRDATLELAGRMADLVGELVERERESLARRAEAARAGASLDRMTLDELQRIQAMRAVLEAAAACARGDAAAAKTLIAKAAAQIQVWIEE